MYNFTAPETLVFVIKYLLKTVKAPSKILQRFSHNHIGQDYNQGLAKKKSFFVVS